MSDEESQSEEQRANQNATLPTAEPAAKTAPLTIDTVLLNMTGAALNDVVALRDSMSKEARTQLIQAYAKADGTARGLLAKAKAERVDEEVAKHRGEL